MPFTGHKVLISSDNQSLSVVIFKAMKRHKKTHESLILSCLSCSIVVIMIITSTQTDSQSSYGVCHEWINGALNGLRGIEAHHKQHIRPHGNFMRSDAPVCLTVKVRKDSFLMIINDCPLKSMLWVCISPTPLFAPMSLFRCQGYVMIPRHT